MLKFTFVEEKTLHHSTTTIQCHNTIPFDITSVRNKRKETYNVGPPKAGTKTKGRKQSQWTTISGRKEIN